MINTAVFLELENDTLRKQPIVSLRSRLLARSYPYHLLRQR